MNTAKRASVDLVDDPQFQKRIQRLGKNARNLQESATKVTRALHKNGNGSAHIEAFRTTGLLATTCGSLVLGESGKDIAFAWDVVRALLSAQFGFSLSGRDAGKSVLANTLKDGHAGTSWRRLWLSKQGHIGSQYARRYALLSLCAATLSAFDSWYRDQPGTSAALRQSPMKNLVSLVLASRSPGLLRSLRATSPARYLALRKLARSVSYISKRIVGLGGGLRGLARVTSERQLEKKVFAELERLLRRGTERSSLFAISEHMWVLGGRYLNPDLRLSAEWRECFVEGVAYVTDKLSQVDGACYEDLSDASCLADDPLVNRYSPIAWILDLPNEVLNAQLGTLANIATLAVMELTRELEGYLLRPDAEGDGAERAVKVIYEGLMLGTAVGDRFKDLLSDAILAKLDAEEPVIQKKWGDVPDSLRFKENIERGVINLWAKRSDQRPGAILLYGPPGTGKTTIAQVLVRLLNEHLSGSPDQGGPDRRWKLLKFTPADFAREGSDQVVAHAERIFTDLRQVRRCVVLLDEMEEFLRARGAEASEHSRLITTAFLPLLQDAVESREIILIVATNFVGAIDAAVTRRGRFDLILPLGPPALASRTKIVKERLNDDNGASRAALERATGLGAESIVPLVARYTMGYTAAEIKDFVKEVESSFELERSGKNRNVRRGSYESAEAALAIRLWKIRQERVPTALSGRAGCNWRGFQDEAARYRREAAGVPHRGDNKYWDEPPLPDPEKLSSVSAIARSKLRATQSASR